jgi:hypothetical protein
MAPRRITALEDETFHPATCLVSLDPVSGFILSHHPPIPANKSSIFPVAE